MTDTNSWIVFADTHVPYEDLDMTGKKTGGELNFPSALFSAEISANLQAMGITRTSQLIQCARSMDEQQWKAKFQTVWPKRYDGAWRYFRRHADNGVTHGLPSPKFSPKTQNSPESANSVPVAVYVVIAALCFFFFRQWVSS
jgi:hypothetical protein